MRGRDPVSRQDRERTTDPPGNFGSFLESGVEWRAKKNLLLFPAEIGGWYGVASILLAILIIKVTSLGAWECFVNSASERRGWKNKKVVVCVMAFGLTRLLRGWEKLCLIYTHTKRKNRKNDIKIENKEAGCKIYCGKVDELRICNLIKNLVFDDDISKIFQRGIFSGIS